MRKVLRREDFTLEEMKNGVRAGVRDLSLVPFFGSPFWSWNRGVLTGIGDFAPKPA